MWAQLFQENQAIMQSQQSSDSAIPPPAYPGHDPKCLASKNTCQTSEPIEKHSRTLCEQQVTFCSNLYGIRNESTRFCMKLPCLFTKCINQNCSTLFSPTLFQSTQ